MCASIANSTTARIQQAELVDVPRRTAVGSLRSGKGDDKLTGGEGVDILRGDDGDDTYLFGDNWGQLDKVTETSGDGQDTLNFSAVADVLNVQLGSLTTQD